MTSLIHPQRPWVWQKTPPCAYCWPPRPPPATYGHRSVAWGKQPRRHSWHISIEPTLTAVLSHSTLEAAEDHRYSSRAFTCSANSAFAACCTSPPALPSASAIADAGSAGNIGVSCAIAYITRHALRMAPSRAPRAASTMRLAQVSVTQKWRGCSACLNRIGARLRRFGACLRTPTAGLRACHAHAGACASGMQ